MSRQQQMSKDLGLTDKSHACACGGTAHAEATGVAAFTEQYFVAGMTCSHCVASVTEEVSMIDGVESVSVDLNVGGASRITVLSSKPVPVEQIRGAVSEAGYSLGAA